jgi:GNAT acetyltransferase-like protein
MTFTMQTPAAPPRFFAQVDAACAGLTDGDFRRAWLEALERVQPMEPLRAMPLWADHFHRTGNALRLIAIRDQTDTLAGVVPLHPWPLSLRFTAWWAKTINAEWLLGSVPALPCDSAAHDVLFKAVREAPRGAGGVFLESVPTSGFLWRHLRASGEIRDNWITHLPGEPTRRQAIDLPASFEQYLSGQFNKKMRHNLRREVRLLMGREGQFARVDRADQIEEFLAHADAVVRKSWKPKLLSASPDDSKKCLTVLADLADQGLLRAYMLRCEGQPCAMGIGYQRDGVYHYYETAYSEAFAKLSPGRVLLYLMLEDLLKRDDRPARFSFGSGEMTYKDWFANTSTEDVGVLLLPKTLKNRLLCSAHNGMRALRRGARALLSRGRRKPRKQGDH